jgi:hypothetical protein
METAGCVIGKGEKINVWKPIKELDSEIRTIETPSKTCEFFIAEIGLFESLGEQGGDILTELYDHYPTEDEIKESIRKQLKETKAEFMGYGREVIGMNNVLSGREEMQLKALKKLKLRVD